MVLWEFYMIPHTLEYWATVAHDHNYDLIIMSYINSWSCYENPQDSSYTWWRPIFYSGDNVNGCVVRMTEPLSSSSALTSPSWDASKTVQHHHIFGGAPGRDVGVEQSLAFKGRKQYLSCAAGVYISINGSWFAHLNPLLGLSFGLGSVGGHHCLNHMHCVFRLLNVVVLPAVTNSPCRSWIFPLWSLRTHRS